MSSPEQWIWDKKQRRSRSLNMKQTGTQTENWFTIMQNALYVDMILNMKQTIGVVIIVLFAVKNWIGTNRV